MHIAIDSPFLSNGPKVLFLVIWPGDSVSPIRDDDQQLSHYFELTDPFFAERI
jgi:hypothetical protein